jgi:hypothetical protein
MNLSSCPILLLVLSALAILEILAHSLPVPCFQWHNKGKQCWDIVTYLVPFLLALASYC